MRVFTQFSVFRPGFQLQLIDLSCSFRALLKMHCAKESKPLFYLGSVPAMLVHTCTAVVVVQWWWFLLVGVKSSSCCRWWMADWPCSEGGAAAGGARIHTRMLLMSCDWWLFFYAILSWQLQRSKKKKHSTHAKYLQRNVSYKSYVKDLSDVTPPKDKLAFKHSEGTKYTSWVCFLNI